MTTECIEHWQKGSPHGYGSVWVDGKKQLLHRDVYSKFHGISIHELKGLAIRHTCDNGMCINPEHLVLGTLEDNMRDMAVRRRSRHITLTEAQVAEIRSKCKPNKHRDSSKNEFSYRSFAKKFGVSDGSIRSVYLRISFKHLP
ncbi:MAG: HNH endonuclease [Hyphomicrobium sp.]|jgi:hypothetical protein